MPAVPVASQPAEDYGVGTAAVFRPEGDGYIRYDVTDCPLDPETLLRQMVALGGAPEGARVLSARREGGCLTLELSEEAALAESREMMTAMSATFAAAYPELTELRLIAAGKELRLWEQFPREIEPERTVTTPYHQ